MRAFQGLSGLGKGNCGQEGWQTHVLEQLSQPRLPWLADPRVRGEQGINLKAQVKGKWSE